MSTRLLGKVWLFFIAMKRDTLILYRAPTPFGGTAGTVRTLPLPGFEMLQARTEPHLTWDRMCHRPNFNRTPQGWRIQYATESPDLWSWWILAKYTRGLSFWGIANTLLWIVSWAIKYQFKVYIHLVLICYDTVYINFHTVFQNVKHL